MARMYVPDPTVARNVTNGGSYSNRASRSITTGTGSNSMASPRRARV